MKKDNLLNAVIEIDEVEYLINEKAAEEITAGEKNIILKRLVDSKERSFPIDIINHSIEKNGIIDRLEK